MSPSATADNSLKLERTTTGSAVHRRRSSAAMKIRRLSSHSAKSTDLGAEPTIVVPPQNINVEGEASELASSMEIARRSMQGITLEEEEDGSEIDYVPAMVTDKYAYAFDIDGVLIKGGEVIPEAIQAMKMLNGQNSRGIRVPYIFVTNGGGKSEEERCIQLSQQLGIEVSPGQFICGHTPMREMAEHFDTVLVVGGEGEKCREVASAYGFKDVITPGDIIKTKADTTPFRKLTDEEYDNSNVRDFSRIKIQAIFVFADSRDWGSDQQIILDVLTSENGVLGTRSKTYDEGPPIFFAHNDVVWATSHSSVRIGMGALRKSVEAMFEAVTGKTLDTTAFGKPQIGTYEYATRLLTQWRKETHGIDAPPETIYFVGDTPESDIRGTNDFDEQSDASWYSILVRTGVYEAGTTPRYKPKATVDNVLDAVKHGMEREWKKSAKTSMKTSAKAEAAANGVEGTIAESPAAEAAAEEKSLESGVNGVHGVNGVNGVNGA